MLKVKVKDLPDIQPPNGSLTVVSDTSAEMKSTSECELYFFEIYLNLLRKTYWS